MCCLGGLSGVVKVCTFRTTACEAIGGLRVEALSGSLSRRRRSSCGKIGQLVSQDEPDSSRSYEDRSPQSTKQQTNKTVPRWAFFSYVSPVVSSIIGLGMMSPI